MTVASDIAAEQARQHKIHPVRPVSHFHWLAVTTEEILESLQEVRKLQDELMIAALELGRRTQDVVESIDCRDREEAVAALRRELVQSAACIQSWIEWIDEGHRLPRMVTRHDTIRGRDIRQAVFEGDGCKTDLEAP